MENFKITNPYNGETLRREETFQDKVNRLKYEELAKQLKKHRETCAKNKKKRKNKKK